MKSRLIDEPQSWGSLGPLTNRAALFTLCRTMKPLILLVGVFTLPCAARAQSIQADWRRDGVDERVKAALTSQGWRLEDDGRALEAKTKAPVTKDVLDKAVLDLRQGARRAALETVNLMLASGKPLSPEDQQKIETLSADLPPVLVAAILDPRSGMNQVKALVDADLSRVVSYFDGGRTMAAHAAAARPVSAETPGPRVYLPYYTPLEKSIGEKIRAFAAVEIGRDPFGKTVLSHLNTNGKPDLPPIVIEDQNGAVVAQYDIRRRAIVLDRESVLASVVGTVPPSRAFALRTALTTRTALMEYLSAHPEAVSAVVKDNDVVIVHELTHAWQDRRDTIFREITRGNLPDATPLEYEEEAYKTKNLYLHSKLQNDPASVKMDRELEDYTDMMQNPELWEKDLMKTLNDSSPSRALPLRSIQDIQAARLARTRGRAVLTNDDQRARTLDLSAMGRGQKELTALKAAHDCRSALLNGKIDEAGLGSYQALGGYYLVQTQFATRSTDRIALLDLAERNAKASGNAVLIEEVRKAKERKK